MVSCLSETCTSISFGSSTSIFLELIKTLLVAQCSLEENRSYPPDRTEEILKNDLEFDFIIAGAGSAGSVVASRLSEIPEWRVLLIENGEDPSLISDIPGLMGNALASNQNYKYETVFNERFCRSSINSTCAWPRGKALGGSSVINAMMYIRGNARDYNQWAELSDEKWNYENVLPYFRKAERYHPDIVAKYGDNLLGTRGPLKIRPFNYSLTYLHDLLLNSSKDLGIPTIDMINLEQYIGFGSCYGTIDAGIRQNVARAYLSPVKDRKNLYVMKSTKVNFVKIKNNRATGVKVTLKNKRKATLKATKEVILSAGSIDTPHILMLSGIGPKEELEAHKIDVVNDLPVGQNLQDHLAWSSHFYTFINKTSVLKESSSELAFKYLVNRTGDLSQLRIVDITGFINTKNFSDIYPNIQLFFFFFPKSDDAGLDAFQQIVSFNKNLVQQLKKANEKYEIIIPFLILLNPISIGDLKLKSSNQNDHLKIYPNYLDSKEDIDIYIEASDFLQSLMNTNTFKNLGIQRNNYAIAECEKYVIESREYLECLLSHTGVTEFHPVGTCKMGTNQSQRTVVDSNLKVHNIERLRVIDASIMPKIISGNTNAPTIMIAEKGSDFIKKEWLVKSFL